VNHIAKTLADETALGIEAFVEAPRRERLPKARLFAILQGEVPNLFWYLDLQDCKKERPNKNLK